MNCLDFEYDGQRLSDYGCVMGLLNGVPDGQSPSGADIQFSQGQGSNRDIFDLYDTYYEEPYIVTFTICKDPCKNATQEDMYFTPREISHIQRWLCRRDGYHKFKIDQDEYRDLYWMGVFQSQQITLAGYCIGFALTLTTNAPYAFYEDVTLNIGHEDCSNFTVYSLCDEEGYITPNITIKVLEAGDLTITNNRDTKDMVITNCHANETITIDGSHLIISTTSTSHDLGTCFNYYFPKLFNTYNNTKNDYTCNLSCDITFSYAPIIKIGL